MKYFDHMTESHKNNSSLSLPCHSRKGIEGISPRGRLPRKMCEIRVVQPGRRRPRATSTSSNLDFSVPFLLYFLGKQKVKWISEFYNRKAALIILGLFMSLGLSAQNQLTLDSCYAKAERNYPLTANRNLLESAEEYTIANAAKGYLPQIAVKGQASYQSDVPRLDDAPPGSLFPVIPKDQYNIYGEIYQPLTDIYTVSQKKQAAEAQTKIARKNLEVDLYHLRGRINQIFFGILLLDEQVNLSEILQAKIQSALSTTQTAVDNGMRLPGDAAELKAELLTAQQHETELKSARQGFADMLSQFIGEPVTAETEMAEPQNPEPNLEINRPEIIVFEAQQQRLLIQNNLTEARNLPKFGLFFQGGYASPPPVNFLLPEWEWYYVGGLRLSWSISGYYTQYKEKSLLQIQHSTIENQLKTFVFNTNLNLKRETAEITKYKTLLASDREIIKLREEITNAAQSQLENGAITVNEFIQKANAADQARQNKILHRVQLLQAQYALKNTSGN